MDQYLITMTINVEISILNDFPLRLRKDFVPTENLPICIPVDGLSHDLLLTCIDYSSTNFSLLKGLSNLSYVWFLSNTVDLFLTFNM